MSITAIRLIAQREVKARWTLVPGALVFGILAMMVARTLDVDSDGPSDMLAISQAVAFLAAGIIGLSLLGDQLTDGRLSFYFSRPFTPRTIFIGKLLGGIALALAIYICLVIPVVLGFPDAPEASGVTLAGAGAAVQAALKDARTLDVPMPELMMGVAACVTIGMAAGIAVRSRSRWLALDIAGLATLLVMISYVLLHVADARHKIWGTSLNDTVHLMTAYVSKVSLLLVAWLATALVAVTYATARALSRGRIDREIAHTTLSKTLWPIVVPLGAAAVVAVVTWL